MSSGNTYIARQWWHSRTARPCRSCPYTCNTCCTYSATYTEYMRCCPQWLSMRTVFAQIRTLPSRSARIVAAAFRTQPRQSRAIFLTYPQRRGWLMSLSKWGSKRRSWPWRGLSSWPGKLQNVGLFFPCYNENKNRSRQDWIKGISLAKSARCVFLRTYVCMETHVRTYARRYVWRLMYVHTLVGMYGDFRTYIRS